MVTFSSNYQVFCIDCLISSLQFLALEHLDLKPFFFLSEERRASENNALTIGYISDTHYRLDAFC